MTSPAITVDPDDADAQRAGDDDPAPDSPLAGGCQAEELVGIVSIGDLVKHRIERIESEAAAMREYIQSA